MASCNVQPVPVFPESAWAKGSSNSGGLSNIFTSSHHIFKSSHLLILTSSHLHILTSSHLLITFPVRFNGVFLHVRCIPHQNSQRLFWTSVWVCVCVSVYICVNMFLCVCLCLRAYQHICMFVFFTSSITFYTAYRVCLLQLKPWHLHIFLSWHLHTMNIFTWSQVTFSWTYSCKSLASANHTTT